MCIFADQAYIWIIMYKISLHSDFKKRLLSFSKIYFSPTLSNKTYKHTAEYSIQVSTIYTYKIIASHTAYNISWTEFKNSRQLFNSNVLYVEKGAGGWQMVKLEQFVRSGCLYLKRIISQQFSPVLTAFFPIHIYCIASCGWGSSDWWCIKLPSIADVQ